MEPQLDMHIDALKLEAANQNHARVIELIECICKYAPSPWQLRALKDCDCLPVTDPGKGQRWMNSTGAFAVADRREYISLFRGKIVMLDFSLEDIHAFESFLVGLGVHKKFLSVSVQAQTDASETSIDFGLSSNVRRKAYALCRYVRINFWECLLT